MAISVVMIVKNGERRLMQTLQALTSFSEIVLVDTGSNDRTKEIACTFPNVRLFELPFQGFGKTRNIAASFATHKWILALDADEVLSPYLIEELHRLKLNSDCIYSFPFKNYFNGKWIRWCGWHPEKHIRLYHREKTSFSEPFVHEGVLKKNLKEIILTHHVDHFPYETLSDFLIKMERYSTLFAEQYKHRRSSSPFQALLHGAAAFFKSYFLKRGFLGGFEGFVISFYNAHTAFYKYLKLYHLNLCSSP